MRRVRTHGPPLIGITLIVLACYARTLGRSFVGVDFVLLARLADGGFWETAAAHFSGPCFGIEAVAFYRPVSTLVLQLEQLAFGVQATGYLVVHMALHLLNVALVYALAWGMWGRRDRVAGTAAGLLFALYPLHVDSLGFVASYATPIVTSFVLGAFLAHVHGRRLLALLLNVLALGSYEQAVVLPVLLLVHDALDVRIARRPAWREHVACWIATALYFVLRWALLGYVIGGYQDVRGQLPLSTPLHEPGRLASGLLDLALPGLSAVSSSGLVVVLLGLAAVLTAVALHRRGALGDAPRWWLLGVAWVVVTQAPFAFPRIVPGNGRYVYLTSIGLAWLLLALGTGLPRSRAWWGSHRVRVLGPAALLVMVQLPLLREITVAYRDAALLAHRMQTAAGRLEVEPSQPLFLGGVPGFLNDTAGNPVAQVYAWGLSDALDEPFSKGAPRRAYRLPPLSAGGLRPLLEHASARTVFWWDGRWVDLCVANTWRPERVAIKTSPDDELRFRFRSDATRNRLVLVTRVNPVLVELDAEPGVAGWRPARLPDWLVDLERQLYDDVIYWWVEGRDEDGRLQSQSGLETLAPWDV